MRKYLVPWLAIIAFTGVYGQKAKYNQTKGYVANGYDVVSYFNNDPQKGNSMHTFTHNGATFRFKDRKNLNTFKANPKKYIPQYGGWCAYAMAKSGEKVSVNPKTYQIKGGKLYLFYNKNFTNTLKSWNKETPGKLIPKADSNWMQLTKKGR